MSQKLEEATIAQMVSAASRRNIPHPGDIPANTQALNGHKSMSGPIGRTRSYLISALIVLTQLVQVSYKYATASKEGPDFSSN